MWIGPNNTEKIAFLIPKKIQLGLKVQEILTEHLKVRLKEHAWD